MILALFSKRRKTIATACLTILYAESLCPHPATAAMPVNMPVRKVKSSAVSLPTSKVFEIDASRLRKKPEALAAAPATGAASAVKAAVADNGGPGQPEMQSFSPAGNANMVDLFSGDFNYSLPLADVGGYPITLGYTSGVTMDQDASWVGLGWNVNPGTITRNMRGLPDDFSGVEEIRKEMNVKENRTVGATAGADLEVVGVPLSVGASIGMFHNNYKGWGIEGGFNASINAGAMGMDRLGASLSVTNNTQNGVSIRPSLSYRIGKEEAQSRSTEGVMNVGLSYNSRAGLTAMSVNAGLRGQAHHVVTRTANAAIGGLLSNSYISFVNPTFVPSINIPYTNESYTITTKYGFEYYSLHPSFSLSAYLSRQYIKDEDRVQKIPAYGYLNFEKSRPESLLDFNREKDLPYRDKPVSPHIAMPFYTYDVYTITGEGTGGMFRPYRTDIGFVHDHRMRTKDQSGRLSVDIGVGNLAHVGVDLNVTRAYSESGPWVEENPLANTVKFQRYTGLVEGAYFRNPGEMTVNTGDFYNTIGGDDLIAANLYQPGNNSPVISTTNNFTRYVNNLPTGTLTLRQNDAYKKTRDKRTQVISYLNADEASIVGLSKFIETNHMNTFLLDNCVEAPLDTVNGDGDGLATTFYNDLKFQEVACTRTDPTIDFASLAQMNPPSCVRNGYSFSARWTGRLKAPVTGTYRFRVSSDDASMVFLNDRAIIDYPNIHSMEGYQEASINLVAGEFYDFRADLVQLKKTQTGMRISWSYPGQDFQVIPKKYFYRSPLYFTYKLNDARTIERRVGGLRKGNHLSEITVLNPDGKRYVYGLPVYNIKKREATYAVNGDAADKAGGVVKYLASQDSPANNTLYDQFYNAEEVPAYAHAFLLTGIVSPDYVDVKSDGITDDDIGSAVKFNYTRTADLSQPFGWRAPYSDSVSYNPGLRTDIRDDRGSYAYGEKELWYLHSVESKNMIATFTLEDREDMRSINRAGQKSNTHQAKRLKEINIYTKADFRKHNVLARPVKTVIFDYSYELCRGINGVADTTGKLTLKGVWFTYNGNRQNKKDYYQFRYNGVNPDFHGQASDRWGTYKDPAQNPGSVSGNILTNEEFPYSIQDSVQAAKNAGAWALDEIIMPSGGRLKVTYESDDYAFVQHKRAAQMFKIAGFAGSAPSQLSDLKHELYGATKDYHFVGVNVSRAVTSKNEVLKWYLEGIEKTYFKLFVKMPSDKWGSGFEYIPTYAQLDLDGGYGFINNGKTIWFKVKPVDKDGAPFGDMSPFAKSAIQFLKENLPSKAYPGTEVGDNLGPLQAAQMLFAQVDNIWNAAVNYDATARMRRWARNIDTSRTLVRLNNPYFKKYGGGHRVKKIEVFDNWESMTGQRESTYGQEYAYTTTREVNGVKMTISSGVAAYEPGVGAEENPWRQPIEYSQQIAPLAPVSLGYSEEPLGESLFPGASVGYSVVKVRSIHNKKVRSATGYDETRFYTTYDFPTYVERSSLALGLKRFKPGLSNFLRINARHYVGLSQGFKVELNDMNGKLKSQASYADTGTVPLQFSGYYYKVENPRLEQKRLVNTAMTMDASGVVDTATTIGKDIELMMDMREQRSVTNANNISINTDAFAIGVIPALLPSLINLAQREETKYRSVGATKVINRHGVQDSVVVIEKGSKVLTRNLVFDAESGSPVLTSIQNEFDDPVYQFQFPAGWAYDGMAGAYKNIDARFIGIDIQDGRIPLERNIIMKKFLAPGDELLVGTAVRTGGTVCAPQYAAFPVMRKVWVVNANHLQGDDAPVDLVFIEKDGKPFSGYAVNMRVIRSGRKNISASAGDVASRREPLARRGDGRLVLSLGDQTEILQASAAEFSDVWKVTDRKLSRTVTDCVPQSYANYLAAIGDCGGKVYTNSQVGQSFTCNNCPIGANTISIMYTVWAGTYTSTISQADADAQALADIAANGQAYANEMAEPVFYNAAVTVERQKNDCGMGTGTTVSYTVPAGKYMSSISQADADSMANNEIDEEAQMNANMYGLCGYGNIRLVRYFERTDCGPGGVSSMYEYVVPAGKYTSAFSLEEAQLMAEAEADSLGQIQADLYATCTYKNVEATRQFVKNDCEPGGEGQPYTYVVPAGAYESLESQADANAMAEAEIDDWGQIYANSFALCRFVNAEKSQAFLRQDCAPGSTAVPYVYTVEAGTFESFSSQEDADNQALADIALNGQNAANQNGQCRFVNTAQSGIFYKQDCAPGGTAQPYTYTVAAGTIESFVSQADADAQAVQRVTDNGQNAANQNGQCRFVNTAQNGIFYKQDCATGGTAQPYTYTVAAGSFESFISQADADSKAVQQVTNNGQNEANLYGQCRFVNTAQNGVFYKQDCASGGTAKPYTYTVAAGTVESFISQADADSKAAQQVTNNGQNEANLYGQCGFVNVEKSGVFYKQDCASGGTAQPYTYTVAAGTIQSLVSQADADNQAVQRVTDNGQNAANLYGLCRFVNTPQNGVFYKQDCATGGTAQPYTYTVAAGSFESFISQADADSKAVQHVTNNGQSQANLYGQCRFVNVEKYDIFFKQNCDSGGTAQPYVYSVAAGTFVSFTSQADADGQAVAHVLANGPGAANQYGLCRFVNKEQTGQFFKQDCATGGIAQPYYYTVATGTTESFVSQADANSKAQTLVSQNGQANANLYGKCYFYNAAVSRTCQKSNCTTGTGSVVTYNVPYAKHVSEVSQAAADLLAQNDLDANTCNYANDNGTCNKLYLKITTTNVVVGNMVQENTYDWAIYTYADVYVSVFADAACTIPAEGDQYIELAAQYNWTQYDPYETGTGGGVGFSFALEGHSTFAGNIIIGSQAFRIEQDENGNDLPPLPTGHSDVTHFILLENEYYQLPPLP
ncbi:DUF5977 domain-containing protein [Chitinophaga lutea]